MVEATTKETKKIKKFSNSSEMPPDLHFSFLYNDETDHWEEMQDKTVLPALDKSSPVLSRMLLSPERQKSRKNKNEHVWDVNNDIKIN